VYSNTTVAARQLCQRIDALIVKGNEPKVPRPRQELLSLFCLSLIRHVWVCTCECSTPICQ
jgi:hypothetical protein